MVCSRDAVEYQKWFIKCCDILHTMVQLIACSENELGISWCVQSFVKAKGSQSKSSFLSTTVKQGLEWSCMLKVFFDMIWVLGSECGWSLGQGTTFTSVDLKIESLGIIKVEGAVWCTFWLNLCTLWCCPCSCQLCLEIHNTPYQSTHSSILWPHLYLVQPKQTSHFSSAG